MIDFVVIACVILGGLLVRHVARAVHVWFALRDILELPNVIQIHRVNPSSSRQKISSGISRAEQPQYRA
jgi:hypothetical protein